MFHLDPTGAPSIANTYNGIFMDGVQHEVHGDVTWSNTEVPYVMYDTVLGIGSGDPGDTGHLTLADGVIVKLRLAGRIDLNQYGTLTQGTGVVFTSLRDDSRLGDTGGDGASTPVARGLGWHQPVPGSLLLGDLGQHPLRHESVGSRRPGTERSAPGRPRHAFSAAETIAFASSRMRARWASSRNDSA